jgi:hypothetical protein
MGKEWGVGAWIEKSEAYLSVAGQIYLQCFGVVLEAQRRHCEEDVLAVYGLSLLLLAFFGCCY